MFQMQTRIAFTASISVSHLLSEKMYSTEQRGVCSTVPSSKTLSIFVYTILIKGVVHPKMKFIFYSH